MLFVVRDNQAWGRENIGRILAGNERTCASEGNENMNHFLWFGKFPTLSTWQSGSTKNINSRTLNPN